MGNVFYTHQMVELYARTTNYEPVVCCLINENTIKALIVGVFISEPGKKRKLLQVVLFGQPELNDRLKHHSVRQLRQRISFQYQDLRIDGQGNEYSRSRNADLV